MAEVSLSSNLSKEGTEVTIDGKKPKGEIIQINFSMYQTWDFPTIGEPTPRNVCSMAITSREEDTETGDMKETTVSLFNDGTKNGVTSDSITRVIGEQEVIDHVVKLLTMRGRIVG